MNIQPGAEETVGVSRGQCCTSDHGMSLFRVGINPTPDLSYAELICKSCHEGKIVKSCVFKNVTKVMRKF